MSDLFELITGNLLQNKAQYNPHTEEINKALNSSLVNFVNGDLGFATLKNIFRDFSESQSSSVLICLFSPAHKGLTIRVCCPLMDIQRTSLQELFLEKDIRERSISMSPPNCSHIHVLSIIQAGKILRESLFVWELQKVDNKYEMNESGEQGFFHGVVTPSGKFKKHWDSYYVCG